LAFYLVFGVVACLSSPFFFHKLKMLLHTFDKTHCETLSGIVEVWQRYPFFAWIAYVGRKKKLEKTANTIKNV
jgi:hypothetical protein